MINFIPIDKIQDIYSQYNIDLRHITYSVEEGKIVVSSIMLPKHLIDELIIALTKDNDFIVTCISKRGKSNCVILKLKLTKT